MRKNTTFKHRGAWAELAACQWLLSQGYEVFRNVSPYGGVDIIALRGTETLKIDVKGYTKGKNYLHGARAKPNQAGVMFLLVSDSGECEFIKPKPADAPFACETCHTEFINGHIRRRFCSSKCRKEAFLKRRACSCELAV